MAEYTEKQREQRKEAVKRYQETIDRINCAFPKGTKERIKNVTGKPCNAFIKECVLRELENLEKYGK